MEITFVRHGQTEWNSLGKQQGKEDIPLNSRGIEQAKQTAQLLADRQFDRQIPIFYEPCIAERDMGEFQGKRWDEFDTRAFWDYAANHHYQQAENIRDFYDRVYNFLDELKGKPGRALLVSHGGVFAPVSSYAGRSKKEDNLIDNLLENAQAFTFVI